MRSQRAQANPTRSKVGIFTGGIKENKPQIELNMGDLVRGVNYQEVDGAYHGYKSIAGYEIFDGQALASSIAVPSIEDRGNDSFTKLLLESNATTLEDLSMQEVAITASADVIASSSNKDNLLPYAWKFTTPTASITFPAFSFSTSDFCIEAKLYIEDVSVDSIIYDDPGVLTFKVDGASGKLYVIINEGDVTEEEQLFDTVLAASTYYNISLRRVSDLVYANIDGDDETSYIVLPATTFAVLAGSGNATFQTNGWFTQYRISIGTRRRVTGNYTIVGLPYVDPQYYYLDYDDVLREAQRDTITGVDGSGAIRGCTIFEGDVYAARNTSDGQDGALWVSSAAGWVEITHLTITLSSGGKYKFIEGAFDLLTGKQREKTLFFVSGVDPACYVDSGSFVPITHADLPTDVYPTTIVEFKNRLWLGYDDGRLYFSNVGDPTDFDSTTFAGVVYLEDKIIDLATGVGDTLVVFCETSTQIIKALSTSDVTNQVVVDYLFSNESFSTSGALDSTAQRLFDDIFYIDESGLVSLQSTQTFGDFQTRSYSKNIQNTLSANLSRVVCSYVNKSYNQYRLFFNNGQGLIFTFGFRENAKIVKGVTTFTYGFNPTCCASGDDDFFIAGDDEGNIYKLDSGTSFNGDAIDTLLMTSYHHYNTPMVYKRYRTINVEGIIPFNLDLNMRAFLDYHNSNFIPQSSLETLDFDDGAGSKYGTGVYGSIRYANSENQTPTFYVNSYGTNMSLTISTSDKYVDQHIFSSMVVQYSINGRKM